MATKHKKKPKKAGPKKDPFALKGPLVTGGGGAGTQRKLTPAEIANLWVQNGGSKDPKIIAGAVAIAMAESGGDTQAKNQEGNSPPSTDRGLWQMNSYWHKDVSDACAFDAACSTKKAIQFSKNGKDWGQWSTKGADGTPYLTVAKAAASGAPPGNTSGGGILPSIDVPDLGIPNAIGDIVKLISRLFEPDFWLRVGKALLGFIFLLFATQIIAKALLGVDISNISPAKKLVGKVA